MNIPKTVKIGGHIYSIELTERMDLGRDNVSAEILYNELIIRINPNQAQQKQESDLLHEIIHGIWHHLGYILREDAKEEKEVEELAQALYQLIQDNPALFAPREEGREDDADQKV